MTFNTTLSIGKLTNASGLFNDTSEGGWQGFAQDDYAVRSQLRSALVAPGQETPLWGGCAVTAALAAAVVAGPPQTGGPAGSFQAMLTLASAEANITGFTVWNQALATVLNPSSQDGVPFAYAGDGTNPGGAINFYELGSNAEIWVQCTQAVATALRNGGGYGAQAVYWDYTNQVLLNAPGGTAIPVQVVRVSDNGNAMVVNANGTWNQTGYAVLIKI